jgi:CheY-like chemotaxis protein
MNFRNRTRPQWTGKVFGWGVLLWTLLLGGGLVAYQLAQQQETARVGVEIARISLEKDLLFRRWGASHGGVYVPITPQTPPNPYLERVPERDLTTPAGRSLTLVNPAYMVRQIFELQQEQTGLRDHITSLNPLRPENAPDPWEAAALRSFEAGETEAVLVTTIGEEPYLRLMRPLVTEGACLKGHATQGYELRDLRGGLSVAVPLAPLPAANGEEGLRVLAGERPEVILTDLRMPVLDGFGVLAALRSQGSTIPVITVTGMGDEQALAEALRLGANRCLVKPILQLPNLVAMIETLRGAPKQG